MRLAGLLLVGAMGLVSMGCGTTGMQPGGRLEAPPDGKALINFWRPSGWGGGVPLQFFDAQGKLLGNLYGSQSCQYLPAPGEVVLYGDGESKTVIAGQVEAGKVYDVILDVAMGFWKANVQLHLLEKADERRGELGEFAARCRPMELAPGDPAIAKFEDRFARDMPEIKADFLGGDKQDRTQKLGPEDAR